MWWDNFQGGKRAGCGQSGTWGKTDSGSPKLVLISGRRCSVRHPEAGARMPLWREESSKAGRPQPTRNGGRQGERLSESSESRLTAHAELGGLSADLHLAWANGSRGRTQAGCVSLCVACLSTPRVVGVYPRSGRLCRPVCGVPECS